MLNRLKKQIKKILRRGQRSGVIRFGCSRGCEEGSCLVFKINSINYSGTCAEVTGNILADLSKEYLQLFGHDVVLFVYSNFLDYALCSAEGDRVERIFVQLARLDSLIAITGNLPGRIEKARRPLKTSHKDSYASYMTATIRKLVDQLARFKSFETELTISCTSSIKQ